MVLDSSMASSTHNYGLGSSSVRVNSTKAVSQSHHHNQSSIGATMNSTQNKAGIHLRCYPSQQQHNENMNDLNQLILPQRFRDHFQSRNPQDPQFMTLTTTTSSVSTNATVDTQRSQSIPIHRSSSYLQRSPSEVKLHEDQEVADWRDYVMFTRIVNHIVNQKQGVLEQDSTFRRENDMTLAHIIGTRNESLEATTAEQTNSNVASFLPNHYLFPPQVECYDEDDDDDEQDRINHFGCYPHQHLHMTPQRSSFEEEPIFELEM